MNIELLGKKLGMSQVYDDENNLVPVTIIEAGPCPVLQVKTLEKDGYSAIQIGFNPKENLPISQIVAQEATPRKLASNLNRLHKRFVATTNMSTNKEMSSRLKTSKTSSS